MAAERRVALLASSLLLGAATLAHAADLYQWKDSKGVTHYSDAPPKKGLYQARSVHIRDGQASAPAASPAKAPTTARTAASANCTLAKTNLERLKAGGNIGLDANGDGTPDAPMGAEEQIRQTKLAEGNITTYCASTATTTAP